MKRHLSWSLPILLGLFIGSTVIMVSTVYIQVHGTGLFRKGWKEILPAEDRGEVSMPVELLTSEPVVRNWQGELYAFGIYCADAYCWTLLEFNPTEGCYQVYPRSACIPVGQVPLAACDASLVAFREFNHPPQRLIGCLVSEYTYAGKKGIIIVAQDQSGAVWMWEHAARDTHLFMQLMIFGSALLAGLLGWLAGSVAVQAIKRKR